MNLVNMRMLRRHVAERRFSFDMHKFNHQGRRCLITQACLLAGLPVSQATPQRAQAWLDLKTGDLFHLERWPKAYQEMYKRDRHAAAAALLDAIIERGESAVFAERET